MVTFVSCVICIAACMYEVKKSKQNAKQGIIDKGAQHAITYGVFFTFLGIAVGLLNFNPSNLSQSINEFLGGMKTAFFTSIIGMGFAWYISRIVQDKIEIAKDFQMAYELHQLQGIQKLSSVESSVAALTNQIGHLIHTSTKEVMQFEADKHRSEEHLGLLRAIDRLRASVEKSSPQSMSEAVEVFSSSIQDYLSTVKNTSHNMENFSTAINNQITSFRELGASIRQANEEQAHRLDLMGQSIRVMAEFAEKSYANSNAMMTDAQKFQSASLDNEKQQIQILGDNTDKIYEMKTAFNKFLEDMAEQNNKKFIEALNESMKDLNTKLTEQFGENFKELNAAVKDLVTWQDKYKDIVEHTTKELEILNSIFSKFTNDIIPRVNDQTERINENLVLFGNTTEKNIALQRELASTADLVTSAIEQNKETTRGLDNFNKQLLEETHSALSAHQDNFEKFTASLANSLNEANRQSIELSTNTTDTLRKFNATSGEILRNISDTLERFDADFRDELQKAMQKLVSNMEQIAKSTGTITEKQVQELAGALGAVTHRMTDNYTTLVEKIAQVDELLNKRH